MATKTKKLKAVFTQFIPGTNWCKGTIGQYLFEAKLFDAGSSFGINDGRVSKLSIWDEKVREEKKNFFDACIYNYDRGEDIEPTTETKPYFEAVMEMLENAPKRFSK